MSVHQLEPVHPVARFAESLAARLGEVAGVSTWSMSCAEQRATLVALARARAELDALYLHVLAEADATGAGDVEAAATAADWVAGHTRQVRREARAELRLAQRLADLPVLRAGLEAGRLNVAQARAIVRALDQLPDDLDDHDDLDATATTALAAAEEHLVGLAAHHDARELAVLGRHLFAVVAPDRAEELEGQALAREEARAAARTSYAMRFDDQGLCHGRFTIPAQHGERLQAMLLRIHDPKTPATPRQRGQDFCTLLETKCPTTLLVTIDHDALLSGLGAAQLETGGRISAAEARRLVCQAGIIPAVLGTTGTVLDMGRKTRFFTETQRAALVLRDRGCTATGCDRPPALCHAHHDHPWSHGGSTAVDNGRLLCGHHHRRIHDPAYDVEHLPNGKVAFHRRT